MIKRFGLSAGPAIAKVVEIVPDMGLKGGKFYRHEEARLNAVVHGPGELLKNDWKLVRQPGAVFDGLYALPIKGAGR
jgi:hypothetical protein